MLCHYANVLYYHIELELLFIYLFAHFDLRNFAVLLHSQTAIHTA